MKIKPIYVEIDIQSDMESLWKATQTPKLHEQWDLRFSSITYLPKEENETQHFLYQTVIGLGLAIAGWGKSIGSFDGKDGSRTSSLHFGTEQPMSIIREGKGYWKYRTHANSVNFLTQYDYNVNWGKIGRFVDFFFFRPAIGWATALSFDVLKRWLEKGETPAPQYIRFFSSWLIAFLFSFVWIYQGLVPKLLGLHPQEVSMAQSLLGTSASQAESAVLLIGVAEILFGCIWFLYKDKRKLFGLQLVLFPALTVSAFLAESASFVHPFNPLTFNLALFVLSIIGFGLSKNLPTARSCKRKR
ncbi:DoxX-like family protein [Planomicrobium sp. CPCC 101079]|uniref:DoxX-like family protein n=1 Tax=Planomicrobium sp. CPCC 101079 TaxID=2599618 RepID=UPI0011B4D965|nr:DoxX-like family protein [Planomicrobium sp. CPCC 101079]TWT08916.1 hypothetical protein FQV28_04580 [Planomicrobium sp. CPCC 101079]